MSQQCTVIHPACTDTSSWGGVISCCSFLTSSSSDTFVITSKRSLLEYICHLSYYVIGDFMVDFFWKRGGNQFDPLGCNILSISFLTLRQVISWPLERINCTSDHGAFPFRWLPLKDFSQRKERRLFSFTAIWNDVDEQLVKRRWWFSCQLTDSCSAARWANPHGSAVCETPGNSQSISIKDRTFS